MFRLAQDGYKYNGITQEVTELITDLSTGKPADVAIIGAGPAGISAAVNGKARNLTAIVIDHRHPVAKVDTYPEVTNYLGFPRVTGAELAAHFSKHFAHTGYTFHKEKALRIMPDESSFIITTDQGLYRSITVILAFGVTQTKLLRREEQFLGRGVSYCVTCDGALYRDKDVVVVGYIPEGEEEANALAGLARSVTYLALYPNVEALDPSVTLVRATPLAIEGDSRARALKTDEGTINADGIFIVRSAIPVSTLIDNLEMEGEYIKIDCNMSTNIPGVFAAGDCTGPPFQIAKAVGQGQVAALSAARYVHKIKTQQLSQ
ncbi:MAG: NAD(P)/FAD-dependent oxidoreductase [Armatimonadota bacterium]